MYLLTSIYCSVGKLGFIYTHDIFLQFLAYVFYGFFAGLFVLFF